MKDYQSPSIRVACNRASPGCVPLICRILLVSAMTLPAFHAFPLYAQVGGIDPTEFYQHLKTFDLSENSLLVEQLTIKRDRMEFVFDGQFHLAMPVNGRSYGAVFIGRGRLRVEPWSIYEKANIRRLLKSDVVEATFKTAVLRFTDDTLEQLSSGTSTQQTPPEAAQKLARKYEADLLKKSGLNVSARIAQSVFNGEQPGFFFGQFDGGNRGKFNVVLDHQAHVPTTVFGINGGEKGLVWKYRKSLYGNDVWTAFYNQDDFDRGIARYSDAFDLVTVRQYRMDIDVRDPGDWLRYTAELDLVALKGGFRLLPFAINEGLGVYNNSRLKRSVRILKASLDDGSPVSVIQEPWEKGVTLILPRAMEQNEQITVHLGLEGKDSLRTWERHYHYLRMTTSWYPRHGYLARSNYDLTFHHDKKYRVVSIGNREKEGADENDGKLWSTRWVTPEPVSFITFALGQFERHEQLAEVGGEKIPVEFYSIPGSIQPIKEDFVLAELGNGLRFYSALYGKYPYGRLGAAFFPASFGQGFPTLLMLPVEGYARTNEFVFIAHEGAHQWWGNIVSWRSYRDQWLSEGFAEYSGVLYTGRRQNPKKIRDLVRRMRRAVTRPPITETGIASGKVYEVGPIILGHRLSSRRALGAYQTLIYDKGALVLRMLHFLFRDPSTGEDKWFFDMMKDFVDRHRGSSATTESFFQVASEHIAGTPIGKKYGLKDMQWFMNQWVYQHYVPSFEGHYRVVKGKEGGYVIKGKILQTGVPEDWFTPLPLTFEFSGKRFANGTIHALGPETSFEIPLPEKPKSVKLDPSMWILSEKMKLKKR